MPLSAIDVVSPAFERTKRLLFVPFRPGQWLRFALVGFLAGEMGGSGGCSSLRVPLNLPDSQSGEQFQAGIPGAPGFLFFLGIALALFLVLVLVIVFTYINSRMRFVLFDSIVNGECRIRDSWSRRGTPAFRYFLFQIAVALAAFASLGVLIGVPALLGFGMGLFENPRQHILALVLGGLLVGLLFLTWLIAFILLQVLTKDFIVPQMALDDVTATEAWRRLWNMMSADKVGYAGYLGMKVALSLGAAIVLGIVTLLVFLVILIPVGGLGVITVLGGSAAGLTWNPLTIAIAIVVGAIVFLALILIASLISVPAIVFFPAYSIYFFAGRFPRLHMLLNPGPSAAPEFPSSQP